ncbi:calycin-like domain-containing protein [Bacteroides sp. An322]|uniref:calycin-like domain-containing protein n=1 Tax=Bacteroides sp. An322 TaxID=1965632 RepID=UPI000B3937A2|nr:calycin-like domain-containing protein [Bacteroides sp. An322]OUO24143.1 hypothetical protein B5F91_00640 [Bacteroides sp. An322]
MKKSLFFYLFAVLCTMSLFTSCSDDDDAVSLAEIVAGDYDGTLDIAMDMGGMSVSVGKDIEETVEVTKVTDAAVDLRIQGFSIIGMDLGNIELKNCQLTEVRDGVYDFTASSNLNVVGMLSATVNGTGEFSGNTLTLNLDITDIALDGNDVTYTVDVKYEGTKVAGN